MIGKIVSVFCCFLVLGESSEIVQQRNVAEKLGASNRIIGGKEATPHAYPFVASIYIEFGSDGFGCGGSLLNSEWVLTAAHCVYHRKTGEYYTEVIVTLGEHDENKEEGTEKVLTVSKVIIHDNYIKNGVNDLALLKLPSTVTMTDAIKPVCLTPPNKDYIGKTAKAVGWGRISTVVEDTSPVLKEANIPVVSDDDCASVSSYNSKIMMCGGFEKEKGQDTVYSGDSGGPLFIEDSSGKPTVVGVNSFVTVDKENHIITHAIFVKLAAHIDWINKNIQPSKMCTA